MKFTANILYKTAESFFHYTSTSGLGIKAKSKSFDLWAKILSEKSYSSLMSSLKAKDLVLEYELNTEIIITNFKEKNRAINKDQAVSIFANSIADHLSEISELLQNLVSLLKKNNSYSVMANYPTGIGLLDDTKPGYTSLTGVSFSHYDRAQDFQQLILTLAEQPLMRHYEIFAAITRNGNKYGNQKFRHFLKLNKDFSIFISQQIFLKIELDDEYPRVEAVVADIVQEYFLKTNVKTGSFLTVDTPMVTDFIESVSGTIMSTLEYYRDSDDDDIEFDERSLEFSVQRKIEFYIGE